MISIIKDRMTQLIELCKKHQVDELYLFGSALSVDFNAGSDLDFAVLFNKNLNALEHGDSFLGLMDDLTLLFDRNIDLISYRVIKNPVFKEELDRTKKILYAAA